LGGEAGNGLPTQREANHKNGGTPLRRELKKERMRKRRIKEPIYSFGNRERKNLLCGSSQSKEEKNNLIWDRIKA
jgi:hypothetical protein